MIEYHCKVVYFWCILSFLGYYFVDLFLIEMEHVCLRSLKCEMWRVFKWKCTSHSNCEGHITVFWCLLILLVGILLFYYLQMAWLERYLFFFSSKIWWKGFGNFLLLWHENDWSLRSWILGFLTLSSLQFWLEILWNIILLWFRPWIGNCCVFVGIISSICYIKVCVWGLFFKIDFVDNLLLYISRSRNGIWYF